MNRLAAVLLLTALLVTVAAGAAEENASFLEVGSRPVVTTLDNGVTVAVLEEHQSPVVALRIYVRAGSMHEGALLGAGVSHFLEHLVCGGTTAKRPEEESQRLLEAIGAQANAYTSRDYACYHITTAARFFDTALELLADWIANAAITQEEWDREYEVIQREMETRATNPNVILSDAMHHLMFQVFPARVPVIGYGDAFRKLTRDDVYAYYKKTYRPDNLLVVVAGDVRPDEVLAKVGAAFGDMPRLAAEPIVLPAEPRQVAPRRVEKTHPVSRAHLMISWRTIPLVHPDLYPLDVLSYVLSAGESSRLVRRLHDELGLVHGIDSYSYTPGYDGGEFAVYATLGPDRLEAAEAAILEEIRRVREELVSDEELRKAKRQKISDHVFGLQTVEALAVGLGLDILAARDPDFGRNYTTRIQATTAEEVREAARRYLTEDRLCVVVVRPPETAAEAARAEAKPGGAAGLYATTLPNGLPLLVRRNPRLPIVSIQAFFFGGVRGEPEGKNGVSAFTARLLTRGTESRSADEIAAAFDRMGGSISGGSGNNTLFLAASCLSEDLDEAMTLFADVLLRPSFPEQRVERMRPSLVAAAESRTDDWHAELNDAFEERWFTAHPYRNPAVGRPEVLRALKREELAAFHRRCVQPGNGILAVYGDVDPDKIEALAARLLRDWPAAVSPPPAPAPEPPREAGETVRIAGKHEIGAVWIGYPGASLRDVNDRYAMDVLDAVLSGVALPRGWLHETLRGKGLVYEVHAFNYVGLEPGYFAVYAGCEPERVEEVRQIILDQVGRLFTEEISEAELTAARQICITADVLERQTNAQQAMRNALDALYGLGGDFADRYEEGILAVTAGDVRRVAETYLKHPLCIIMTPGE